MTPDLCLPIDGEYPSFRGVHGRTATGHEVPGELHHRSSSYLAYVHLSGPGLGLTRLGQELKRQARVVTLKGRPNPWSVDRAGHGETIADRFESRLQFKVLFRYPSPPSLIPPYSRCRFMAAS
ncbi:hypothetical protein N7468_005692 [Penicillium chermesinum]|uniref:Uncharacterized protein n=1 Tax=Penicillium chermesinum TaxID=63820 RepID=A0A9W9P014_9EURO|nr:uncharacterized protein N7468_005692 [Penicillium chermesinum]KAJ5232736.1 hypothetical protein N7468_005692 [Penicillium chermesinum]